MPIGGSSNVCIHPGRRFKKFAAIGILFFKLSSIAIGGEMFDSHNQTLFSSSWSNGIDKRISIQATDRHAVEIEDTDIPEMPRALKVKIARNDNFEFVANGVPRAELSFDAIVRFQRKRKYIVKWQTYIPIEYRFDEKQPEVISQIHQGNASGYPTLALFFSSEQKYGIRSRTGRVEQSVGKMFGNPMRDKGKIVNWTLLYIPDDTGKRAVTELYKDDLIVFRSAGISNAYPGDDSAYFKIGLYKADWIKKASDVNERVLYYGRISISVSSTKACGIDR
jgi:hypothetical protein